MGQYYKPVNVDKMQFVYSHAYNNGLKLMEHSWIGNEFMMVVESLIAKGGDWYGDRIVWAGDYADDEPKISLDQTEASNLYYLMEDENEIKPRKSKTKYRYLVNMDNGEYVDMDKVPVSDTCDGWDFRIHPLSLLTVEGNGRGGGDYRGKNKKKREKLVGRWYRKRITIQNEKPEDMKELIFNLVE